MCGRVGSCDRPIRSRAAATLEKNRRGVGQSLLQLFRPRPLLTRDSGSYMLRGKRAVCVLFSLGTSRRETGSNNTNKNSNTNNSRVSSSRFRPCLELVCFPPFFSPNQSWQTKSLALHYGISVGPQMKDQLRLKTKEIEMSATILSGFYDIDMLYKVILNFIKSFCFIFVQLLNLFWA